MCEAEAEIPGLKGPRKKDIMILNRDLQVKEAMMTSLGIRSN